MEGNLPSGNMISGSGASSYGDQSSMKLHHHHHHHQHNNPFTLHHHPQSTRPPGSNFPCDNLNRTISLADFGKGEKGKSSASDEDEQSFMEKAHDSHNDDNRSKKVPTWHRVKWTDPMVRLLITAVSYVGEDSAIEYGIGSRRKYSNLQKKGKWRSISKVLAERGHFVSPQQCEDKFNDLNKRYKRLNEILGRGTSCEVVEKPTLLDLMDHVSDKGKEEVRKILSSKHLYYEEMCSYHNGNRLHLPADPELQRSLRLALRSREDLDEEDQDPDMDDRDEYDHHHGLQLDTNFGSLAKIVQGDMNQGQPEGVNADLVMKNRLVQLEEQKMHIQAQMLELEKERFKWERFREKKDRELEIMKMENERMKLENEQMRLELKRKEMSSDLN